MRAPILSSWRRLSRALLAPAVILLLACHDPALRDLPQRRPIRVDPSRVSSIALIAYADTVDPSVVSDDTLCPHADRRLFVSYFSVPEEILGEELDRAGYPVTRVPTADSTGWIAAYPVRVAVAYVGESRCRTRVPLFTSRQAQDCSVRVKIEIVAEGPRSRVRRMFDRTGEASLYEPVGTIHPPGPTPAWSDAVRDAVRQVLEDRVAAGLLVLRGRLSK
ncbi:MAG: hypothetical protein A2Y95_02990 [Deltaproteobacteria bacterium RBG_13_65_10]|jgi:hypothetical protein|nr:MAG: hypothetical protein A2Y95_02990 [Deltaproteobacteria bacterium RBG_13_65_10]